MRQKIKITDKTSGKVVEKEIEIRNRDHFEAQLKNRAYIFRNRKLYNRKRKYKNETEAI